MWGRCFPMLANHGEHGEAPGISYISPLLHRWVEEEIVHPVRGVASLTEGYGELGEVAHSVFHHLNEALLLGGAEFAADENLVCVFRGGVLGPLLEQCEATMVNLEKFGEGFVWKLEEILPWPIPFAKVVERLAEI